MTWAYEVSAYYRDDIKPPRTPGGAAITIGCADEWTAAIEAKAARSRRDIGRVEVSPPLTGRALEWSLQP